MIWVLERERETKKKKKPPSPFPHYPEIGSNTRISRCLRPCKIHGFGCFRWKIRLMTVLSHILGKTRIRLAKGSVHTLKICKVRHHCIMMYRTPLLLTDCSGQPRGRTTYCIISARFFEAAYLSRHLFWKGVSPNIQSRRISLRLYTSLLVSKLFWRCGKGLCLSASQMRIW
jgi:hypothetical protein